VNTYYFRSFAFAILFIIQISECFACSNCVNVDFFQERLKNVDNISVIKISNDAIKIINSYAGPDNRLSLEEFETYVKQNSLKRIDKDKKGGVNADEFFVALLCPQIINYTTDNNKITPYQNSMIEFNKYEKSILDENDIYNNKKLWWAAAIDLQLKIHKNLAGFMNKTTLDINKLSIYLNKIKSIKERPRQPNKRMESLVKFDKDYNNKIDQDEFACFILFEMFCDLDVDLNGKLDYLEFKKEFDYFTFPNDFFKLAQKNKKDSEDPEGMLVGWNELTKAYFDYNNISLRLLINNLKKYIYNIKTKYPFGGLWNKNDEIDIKDVSKYGINKQLEDNYYKILKEKEKKERKKIFKSQFFEGVGFILTETVYDEKNDTYEIDWEKPAYSFRFIKEFKQAGADAEPGTFSWTRKTGKDDLIDVDFALRLDSYRPSLTAWNRRVITPAFGVDIEKIGTGDDEINHQVFHLLIDALYIHNTGGLLKASHFKIGPSYEFEWEKNYQRIGGTIEWEPYLSFKGISTSPTNYLTSDGRVNLYILPNLALEINSVTNEPDQDPESESDQSDQEETKTELLDQTFVRYRLKTGLMLYDRFDVSYAYTLRHPIDEIDERYGFHELIASFKLDDNKIFSFDFSVTWGQDAPLFKDATIYKIGIGLKM